MAADYIFSVLLFEHCERNAVEILEYFIATPKSFKSLKENLLAN